MGPKFRPATATKFVESLNRHVRENALGDTALHALDEEACSLSAVNQRTILRVLPRRPENSPQFQREFLLSDGLLNQRDAEVEAAVVHDGVAGVTGHIQNA